MYHYLEKIHIFFLGCKSDFFFILRSFFSQFVFTSVMVYVGDNRGVIYKKVCLKIQVYMYKNGFTLALYYKILGKMENFEC